MSLETLYAQNSHRISDMPGMEDIDPEYLAHLGKPFADGTPWSEFRAEVDRENAHLAAQANPLLPIFSDEERTGWSAFAAPESASYRQRVTEECASLAPSGSPAVLDVFRQVVGRAAWWYALPAAGVEEKNADFSFYRLRCVLAGAGFDAWKELATTVLHQVAECPFHPDETHEQWSTLLTEAHRACGWPTALAWMDWAAIPDHEGECYDWLKVAALFHLIKHMRRAGDHLHIVYHGLVESCPLKGRFTRAIGTPQFWSNYARALGKPGGKNSAKGEALTWAAGRLGVDDLLPAKRIAEISGSLLAGSWSTLLPALLTNTSPTFLRPGTRLTGVWKAARGTITPFEGTEEDQLQWDWNTLTAGMHGDTRRQYESCLPRTYDQDATPSTLLRRYYPHWVLPDPGTPDFYAYCAIVDSIFAAALLRPLRPDLAREFPLLVILPINPSVEDSTNQGKGLLTGAIAGALCPGIPLLSTPDSASAPDGRAVASELNTYGTLALDEFQIPTAKSHVLSRDNLQSLCTGGQVAAGKVFENEGKVRLRQPLVMCAKWLDMSDDLVNRTIPFFLDDITDEQRSRIDIKEELESGRAAILLRLAAVALVERHCLTTLGSSPSRAGTEAWRFTTHRFLAARLLQGSIPQKTDEARCFTLVDECRLSFGDDLVRHQELADESGLSATSASGVNLRLSWHAFWAGVDDPTMQNLLGALLNTGEQRLEGNRYFTLSQLCRYRLEALGAPSSMFCRLLPAMTGQEARVSNTALVRTLSLAARAFYAESIAAQSLHWAPLPGDAGVRWEACVVPRSWTADSPSARTLMVSLRPAPLPKGAQQ